MALPHYHILHALGIMCLFIGFGALFNGGYSKNAMKWHGIGMVIMLVSGFGSLAKLGLSSKFPTWVILKLVLWLALGFIPSLVKRGKLTGSAAVAVTLLIGVAIAYLGALKPF